MTAIDAVARYKELRATGLTHTPPRLRPSKSTPQPMRHRMPKFIVHHDGRFFEWSEVIDAPTTRAMTRAEFEAYYRDRHGWEGAERLPERLDRAAANGTSAHTPTSAEDLVSINRAGPNETELSFDEVIRLVCTPRPDVQFDSPLVDAIAANTTATTVDELLAGVDFPGRRLPRICRDTQGREWPAGTKYEVVSSHGGGGLDQATTHAVNVEIEGVRATFRPGHDGFELPEGAP